MAATTAYNFDLLDLADGESGDAAVSVVVDKTKKKKKTAAEAAAKAADPARPASSAQGGKPKFSFCTLVPLDAGTTSTPPTTRRRRISASYILGYRSRIAYAPVWWVDFGLLVAILSVCVDLLVLSIHCSSSGFLHAWSVGLSIYDDCVVRTCCMHACAS